ncbi:MAG: hypothetical protein IPL13_17450 [Saprospiraceae bacterium]|nr:hypothetical protein [Candidatus Brachybacter algidus]
MGRLYYTVEISNQELQKAFNFQAKLTNFFSRSKWENCLNNNSGWFRVMKMNPEEKIKELAKQVIL